MKFKRYLTKNNIENEALPVPRKLSSNCGIGVKFLYEKNIEKIYDEDIEKIFKVKEKGYELFKDFDI
ncbi:putative Se/S carrier-like protein [Clostridium senegalense]|uniref:putative Se/S carrier-like protein n=1 Tax=Clostridium senegalense TaxID=1465809 RepID=UPI0009DB461A|nr:putative Se/S carrier-like protein [Clostridium senegalense]